jgi:bacteriocin biosynthesis cyclodehydratase domain-containing protein
MIPDRIQLSSSLTAATLGTTEMQFRSGEDIVVTVSGNAVRQLIPALLDELHDPKSWSEIVETLDSIATPEVIQQCAEALLAERILVAAPTDPADISNQEHPVFRFFAHPPHDPAELLRKIGEARLGTLCADDLEPLLVQKLRAHGFTQIVDVDRTDLGRESDLQGFDLLIAVVPHMEASTLDTINRRCLDTKTAWLPVDVFSGPFCALGPLITPGSGCCYECYRSRLRSNLQTIADAYDGFIAFQRHNGVAVGHYGMLPAGIDLAFGLVCLEAIKLITEVHVPACVGHNVIVDLIELSVQRHRVLRVPRCAACSKADRAAQGHWNV